MDIGNIGGIASSVHNAVNAGNTVQPGQVREAAGSAALQTADAVRQTAMTPSLDQIKQAVQEINDAMQIQSCGLEFTIDNEFDRTVVKVVDMETEEVIRQIPSEETLAIAKSLDQVIGKLLQEKG